MKIFLNLNKVLSFNIKSIFRFSLKNPLFILLILGLVIFILIKLPFNPLSIENSSYKILARADKFYQEGQLLEARDAYLDFIEKFPSNPRINWAYYQLANTFRKMGLFYRAISFYEKINDRRFPRYSESRYELASCYQEVGKLDKAAQIAKKAIKDFPENDRISDFYLILADFLLEQGREEEAVSFYHKIIENYNESLSAQRAYFKLGGIYFKKKKFSQAIIYYSALVNNYRQSSIQEEALFYLVRSYLARGQTEEAFSMLSILMERYPKSSFFLNALLLFGKVFLDKGEYQKALEIFKRIDKFPTKEFSIKLEAKEGIADVYLSQKNYPEAARAYEQILRDYPHSADEEEIYFKLGQLYLKMGNYSKAVDTFQIFIRYFPLSPQIFPAYFNLGQALIKEGYFFKAAEIFDHILQSSSSKDDVTRALLRISDVYMKLGLWEKATIYLKKALSYVDKEDIFQVKINLVESYISCKDFSSAKKIISEILKDFPKDGSVIQQVMDIADKLYFLDEKEMAFEIYQKIAKVKSLNEDKRWLFVLFKIGNFQKSKGKINSAIKTYYKLLDLSKKYSDPRILKIRENVLLSLTDIYYFSKKNYKKALSFYLKMQKEYPDSEDIAWCIYQIANCYRKTGSLKLADKYYQKLRDKFPDTLWAKISEVFIR